MSNLLPVPAKRKAIVIIYVVGLKDTVSKVLRVFTHIEAFTKTIPVIAAHPTMKIFQPPLENFKVDTIEHEWVEGNGVAILMQYIEPSLKKLDEDEWARQVHLHADTKEHLTKFFKWVIQQEVSNA